MKIVNIVYTTSAQFVETNQKNIKAVMAALREMRCAGINYPVCLAADNRTFIHTAFFNSEEDQQRLQTLPAFRYFQEQLRLSKPDVPPEQQILQLVDASVPVFNEK